jgi:hypothetical protein
LGRTCFGQTMWVGPGPARQKKRERAGLLGRLSAQLDSAGFELDGWARLAKFI